MDTHVLPAVRRATAAEHGAVVEVLAEAFQDDPMLRWCYPDAERRRQLLPAYSRLLVEIVSLSDGVWTVDGNGAVMLAVPSSGAVDPAGRRQLNAALREVGAEYGDRLVTATELVAAYQPTRPYLHVLALAVRGSMRSRGLGSAVLTTVLDEHGRDGLPAYLEASSPASMRLYQRHGFQVTREVSLPDGPPMWCMWWRPSDVRVDVATGSTADGR